MSHLTSEREKWKVFVIRGFVVVFTVLLRTFMLAGIYGALEPVNEARTSSMGTHNAAAPWRLLTYSTTVSDRGGNSGARSSVKRIGMGDDACSKDNILIFQGATTPLPSGIPTYTVQIENACLSGEGCSISDIHLSCGWFSSARLVNPRIFRRISYDDCLVKDGQTLNPGEAISFQYANTFKYQLSVASISC